MNNVKTIGIQCENNMNTTMEEQCENTANTMWTMWKQCENIFENCKNNVKTMKMLKLFTITFNNINPHQEYLINCFLHHEANTNVKCTED